MSPKLRASFLALLFSVSALIPHLTSAADPKFRIPINTTTGISAHYDNDPTASVKDYLCGNISYNGHTGTDFKAPVNTPVYAAASGGLYYRFNNCPTYGSLSSTCGGGYGNHVRIDHEGNLTDGVGWTTYYAHLEKDTATYPQSLNCGALVGKSGSSGRSSGPHLHFEVKKYNYPYNDPYGGACSYGQTWWTTAPPSPTCQ